MKGKNALGDWLSTYLRDRLLMPMDQPCPTWDACRVRFHSIKQYYLDKALLPSDDHSPGLLLTPNVLNTLEKIKKRIGASKACSTCRKRLEADIEKESQELWEKLPRFCGLVSWEKLPNSVVRAITF